jgi:hypothetical protein
MVIRISFLRKLGGFSKVLLISADWDLSQRAARETTINYTSSPLVKYRVHEANLSKNYVKYYGEMKLALRWNRDQ